MMGSPCTPLGEPGKAARLELSQRADQAEIRALVIFCQHWQTKSDGDGKLLCAREAVIEAGDLRGPALDTDNEAKINAAFDRLELALDTHDRLLRWALCIVFRARCLS